MQQQQQRAVDPARNVDSSPSVFRPHMDQRTALGHNAYSHYLIFLKFKGE